MTSVESLERQLDTAKESLRNAERELANYEAQNHPPRCYDRQIGNCKREISTYTNYIRGLERELADARRNRR